MSEVITTALGFILGAALFVLIIFALTLPTMWAVNYLFAPSLLTLIFGVAKFNFWRALVFNFIVGTPFLRGAGKSKD